MNTISQGLGATMRGGTAAWCPGPLEDQAGLLGVSLAQWATRDDAKAQPEIRRAANTAMDAIDGMLAELHQVRQQLVTEIRLSDNATAARVDALLAEYRARQEACR